MKTLKFKFKTTFNKKYWYNEVELKMVWLYEDWKWKTWLKLDDSLMDYLNQLEVPFLPVKKDEKQEMSINEISKSIFDF